MMDGVFRSPNDANFARSSVAIYRHDFGSVSHGMSTRCPALSLVYGSRFVSAPGSGYRFGG
jgi:hypothetical protein